MVSWETLPRASSIWDTFFFILEVARFNSRRRDCESICSRFAYPMTSKVDAWCWRIVEAAVRSITQSSRMAEAESVVSQGWPGRTIWSSHSSSREISKFSWEYQHSSQCRARSYNHAIHSFRNRDALCKFSHGKDNPCSGRSGIYDRLWLLLVLDRRASSRADVSQLWRRSSSRKPSRSERARGVTCSASCHDKLFSIYSAFYTEDMRSVTFLPCRRQNWWHEDWVLGWVLVMLV